jgi:hypothetical protein
MAWVLPWLCLILFNAPVPKGQQVQAVTMKAADIVIEQTTKEMPPRERDRYEP